MIKVDSSKGQVILKGSIPVFMGEYIIISKLIIQQIVENFDEKQATKILERSSELIAKNPDDIEGSIAGIMEGIMEVFNEQM